MGAIGPRLERTAEEEIDRPWTVDDNYPSLSAITGSMLAARRAGK